MASEPSSVASAAAPLQEEEQVDADFKSRYMRLITSQFADDLDKLRQADDFKDSSLPLLVKALEQGIYCFEPEERKVT
jgi:ribosome assembly protein 3